MIKPNFQDSLQTYTAFHQMPDLLNAFGMVMPERSFSNEKYRYGFNGKETDRETQWQDYGFRIYYPGLCKFVSVDPLTKSYPWYTPYQFAGNKPIWAVDLDGMEEFIATVMYDNNQQVSKIRVITYLDEKTSKPVDVDLKKPDLTDVTDKQFAIYHVDISGTLVNTEFTNNPDNAILKVLQSDRRYTKIRTGKFRVKVPDGSKSNKEIAGFERTKSADIRKISVISQGEGETRSTTERMIEVEDAIPGPKVYNIDNSERESSLETGIDENNPNSKTNLPISNSPDSGTEKINVGKLNPSTSP